METLTLPEPAAGLWAAKRRIVHAIPPEMFRSNVPPHLGGRTILAARWKHRISTDINVLLPGRNTSSTCNVGRRRRGASFVSSWATGSLTLAFKAGALWVASQSRRRARRAS